MDFGVRPKICLAMGQKRPKKYLIMLNFLQKIGPIMLTTAKNRPNDALLFTNIRARLLSSTL